MAYIGRDIQYGVLDKQSFTTNGSTTVFTLDSGVKDAKSLLVSVGGIIQEPDVAYTASGTTLTFTAAPANGLVAYAIFLGKTLESGGTRDQITFQSETGDATTTPFTLSATPANAQSIMVTLNGVTQVPNTDYTVSGTVITFTVAPANGMGILVYHLGSAAAIGTINDASVTDAKIVGMSASKISGSLGANTVASTSIVSLDASKLTGTLPGSMAVDTTALDQTIASLGMHIAVADNKVSFNLPGVFIDQFESDSGILTETTVDRDTTGEYVSSISGTTYGTQHTVTPIATANHSTTQAKFGATSIYTDAAGKLSIADHSDFTFGTNDFTIEMWIHTGVGNRVCGQYTSSAADTSFTSWLGGAGTQMYWRFYYGTTYVQIGGGANLGNNAWHHVAAVRNGNTFSSYVDGVLANSTSSSSSLNDSAQPVIFGEGRDNGGGGYIGYFDDIRISNTARYTSAFSVPSAAFAPDANTLLLIGSDTTDGSAVFTDNNGTLTVNATGTLISTASTADSATTTASGVMVYENSSGTATLGTDLKAYFSADDGANWTEASSYGSAINFNGASKKMVKLGKTTGLTSGTQMKLKAEWANQNSAKTITPSGNAQHSTTQNKIGASSMHFDGTGDYITTSANITQSLTGDFTIEGWYYFSAINTTIAGSLSNWDYNSASTGDWILLVDGNGMITFNVKGVGGAGTSAAHGTLNTWKHISVVRESNTTKIYLDGTLVNTPSTSVTGTLSVNNIVTLGRAAINLTGAYNGYIDEFRISNTARYTANFTPSTTAFTSDANTRLLIHSDTTNASIAFTDSSNAEKETRLHGWAVNY